MQVFKLFFLIARSKIGIGILYLVIFLAICFPMVHSSNQQADFEETRLNIHVDDQDQSEASRLFAEELAKKHGIVKLENNRETIMDALYYQIIDYALVINPGYGNNLANLSEEAAPQSLFATFHLNDSYKTAMMDLYLKDYVRNVRLEIAMGKNLPDAIAGAEAMLSTKVDVEMVSPPEDDFRNEGFTDKFATFFRMLCYVLIAVIPNVLAPVMLAMNGEDQKKRIACSRVSTSSYLFQLFAASAVLTVLIWAVFMIGGMFLYGGIYQGINCWLAVLNSFVFAIVSVMFTIFLCSFRMGNTAIGMISQIVGIGMSFLSGAFIPQSMLNASVLNVAKILPGYWYVRAVDILSGAQEGIMGDFWVCIGVQAGFFAIFLAITIILRSHHPKRKRVKAQATAKA
jgi:ABC-2 type transport system permease protein